MSLEIERQFIVRKRLLPPLTNGRRIQQAYLSTDPEVRVRVVDGERASLTVKSDGSISREEYEYTIPVDDAKALLRLTPWSVIVKTRFRLTLDGHDWEIDRYEGYNEGLWSAELELAAEDEAIDLPPWLAQEVTEESRFKNKNLARQPIASWPDRERILAIVDS